MIFSLSLSILMLISAVAHGKVLKIAGIVGAPHFIESTSQPAPEGQVADFIEKYIAPETEKKFKLKFQWHQAPPKRLINEIERHELDVLCCITKNKDREKQFTYGKQPLFSDRPVMIIRKDFFNKNKITDYKIFNGKTITLVAGTAIPDFVKENNIKVYPLTGNDFSNRILILLSSERIDGVYIHLHTVAEHIIKANHYGDQLKIIQIPMPIFDFYPVYSKKLDPLLQKFIDKKFTDYRNKYPKGLIM